METSDYKISIIAPERCNGKPLHFVIDYVLNHRLGLKNYEINYKHNIDAFSIEFNEKPLYRFPVSDLFQNLEKYLSEEKQPVCVGGGSDWEPFSVETAGVNNVNFDLFAAVFYLIARIDELLPNAEKDSHGRVKASACLQHKYGAHKIPIIDVWVQKVREAFEENGIKIKTEKFEWWNTVDVDQVFASQGKPLIKRVGRQVKKVTELKLGEAQKLVATFIGKPDPFDVLPLMHSTKSRDIAFYLVDGNTDYDHPETRNASFIETSVNKNKQRFEIGLHPSYGTFNNAGLIESEKNILEQMLHKPVNFSRQHYLHYEWPQTPILLHKAGVSHDFTMGFANDIGFRAGTSRPFPFFDVLTETGYELTVVPFCVMDVTLKHYLKLKVKEASEEIEQLIEVVKACNGLFISLWHNESLSEIDGWKGWKKLYFEMKTKLTQ